MAGNNRNKGCLGPLLGLFTVLALGVSVLVVLVISQPKVREFVGGIGVPLERLLPSNVTELLPSPTPVTKVEDITEDGLAFQALSDDRKVLYKQLLDGINSLEESFEVYDASRTDIEPTYHALLADHPELFWLDGSTSYVYYEGGGSIKVTPGLSIPLDQVEDVRQQIDAVADAFVESLPSDATEYDVAKAAYEYIIDSTDYDLASSNNQNIQSVFVGHASVCAGYTRAYQFLLQRAGVYCSFVEGRIASTGEDHAWNIVRMGDEYTYVDVTWGDPTYPGLEDTGPSISYDYLGLTTDEILRDDHVFADASMWPRCDSMELSYYAHEGLLFDSYDAAALSEAFWWQAGNDSSTMAFKFSNDEAYVQARDELSNGEFLTDDLRSLFESSDRSSYSYQYQTADSLRILKLFL